MINNLTQSLDLGDQAELTDTRAHEVNSAIYRESLPAVECFVKLRKTECLLRSELQCQLAGARAHVDSVYFCT